MQISLSDLLLILLALLVLAVGTGAFSVLVYGAYRWHRKLSVQAEQFRITVEQLTKSADALATLPKFVEGHTKAAQAMALQIQAFRKSVDSFSRLILRPEDTNSPGLQVPTEEEADKEFSIQQLLQDRPELGRLQAEQLLESAVSPGME